jgi:hypothetical protein
MTNVVDIVVLVNFILMTNTPTDAEFCASDQNSDGVLNVLDVVELIWSAIPILPINP